MSCVPLSSSPAPFFLPFFLHNLLLLPSCCVYLDSLPRQAVSKGNIINPHNQSYVMKHLNQTVPAKNCTKLGVFRSRIAVDSSQISVVLWYHLENLIYWPSVRLRFRLTDRRPCNHKVTKLLKHLQFLTIILVRQRNITEKNKNSLAEQFYKFKEFFMCKSFFMMEYDKKNPSFSPDSYINRTLVD